MADHNLLSLAELQHMLHQANPNGVNVFIIDACRLPGTPLTASESVIDLPTTLAPNAASTSGAELPKGVVMAYSAAAGYAASEGTTGETTVYTQRLLETIRPERVIARGGLPELAGALGVQLNQKGHDVRWDGRTYHAKQPKPPSLLIGPVGGKEFAGTFGDKHPLKMKFPDAHGAARAHTIDCARGMSFHLHGLIEKGVSMDDATGWVSPFAEVP